MLGLLRQEVHHFFKKLIYIYIYVPVNWKCTLMMRVSCPLSFSQTEANLNRGYLVKLSHINSSH